EMLLKTALRRMNENPKADVTDVGENLVEIYPTDEVAYFMLASFQGIVNDLKGTTATYNKLLEITDHPAPVYNMLGYTYLRMNDFEAAEKAFDKYIELVPDHPNPYDSKGDYFMAVKDYKNAYNSFMKAHKLDEAWGQSKAMLAKEEMEKEAIMKVIEEETAAYYANDIKRWAKTYLQDSTNVLISANNTGYNFNTGWDKIFINFQPIFTSEKGENREVKTPVRIKIYDNVAWVVYNNQEISENNQLMNEFIGTNILEKKEDDWKIVYRNNIWTFSYSQPDMFAINSINYAKSLGKSVDEIGRFTGEQFKTGWNYENLFTRVLNNWQIWATTDNLNILEQDENHLKFTANKVFTNLKINGPVFNVSYDEYLTFISRIFEVIAEQAGAVYAQETTPNGVLVSITKK
ncbi:MAG: tetratricopeptide repeat protein, partial [Bacteroidales bacterium]|nr:tetratricopeptide repeat protein [Bacteroidales bacterium]